MIHDTNEIMQNLSKKMQTSNSIVKSLSTKFLTTKINTQFKINQVVLIKKNY